MANLFPCPDCGNSVSRFAEACPQCGRPVALTPEQRAEQQERERQWAAENERLALERQQRARELEALLAAERQEREKRWAAVREEQEKRLAWEKAERERKRAEALRRWRERSRTVTLAIVSATRSVVQRVDKVLRVQTRRQRQTQTRAFLVSTRWWLRKARRVLRDRAGRLEQSHKEKT